MEKRIKHLLDLTLDGKLFLTPKKTEYDPEDVLLDPIDMSCKRVCEYILNQEPYLSENTALTGFFHFDGSVEGDFFTRVGHYWFDVGIENFYAKEGRFVNFEWQHSVADFNKVLKIGIKGFIKEIKASIKNHKGESDKIKFLKTQLKICETVILWAEKCADRAEEKSSKYKGETKDHLLKLAKALRSVPKNPAKSFYEAVLSILIIYAFVPDSPGTLDRFLYPYYKKDIKNKTLTVDEARAYLQELFLIFQGKQVKGHSHFTRGGQCHFTVGGYLPDGSDGFNELSKLIVDSMEELPTYIPEISLRWTKKTPREILRYMMDMERKDPNKRIAFVNDEPRIKALMELGGFPFEIACAYTMVGCNEPQLPGGIFMGGITVGIPKIFETLMFDREKDVLKCKTFDEFKVIFHEECVRWFDKAVWYYEKFQELRSRDTNLVSSFLFEGSIERGVSITQGGAKYCLADFSVIGITTVIDCLTVIKQFVYDEKKWSMKDMCNALKNNWQGYEEMERYIFNNAKFFGNNESISNEMGDLFTKEMYSYFKGKKSGFGYPYIMGNLVGYIPHNTLLGKGIKATPDGRHDGDIISFGIGQSEGRDKETLTALLLSVAGFDKYGITRGDTVTNVMVDQALIRDDKQFEKLVDLFETFFKMGGMHYQLTYVSKEELLEAKKNPDKHRNLRVRVSGFSDYYVILDERIQDEIITRTEKH
ncbi:MAG: hypothetical protein IJS60_05220 [Abditibacteriota bacterium]|nr:hypothetical protein [Abditibacteriota bacterium]